MELTNTKTQSFIIFIILLSHFFSIVIARGPHHNYHVQISNQPQLNSTPSTNQQQQQQQQQHHHHHHHHHHHGKKHKLHHKHARVDLQPEDKQFLEAHNKVRLQLGEPPFIWDPEIAAYALMWANKRMYDCRMVHSYGAYGENIFWGLRLHWTPTDIVNSWAGEAQFYNPTSNECQPPQDCGHYTQIVWRDSIKLGCARVVCAHELGLLGVCSYDPPGNYQNENPFTSYNGGDPVTTQTTPAPIKS